MSLLHLRACVPAVVLFSLALCGCDQDAGKAPTVSSSVTKTVADFFPIRVGEQTVRMQLAVLPAEQQRGLMHRRDLGESEGMLFVYERPQQMSFWMRNTPTPLDIGFFNREGLLLEVYPLQPFDERTVSSRSDEIQFPLEMKQGWYAAHGVKPGAKLDLRAVAAALKERGFDPRRFGLEP